MQKQLIVLWDHHLMGGGGGGGGLSHSRIFHSLGEVTITVEGLQILTYSAVMAIE